MTQPEDGMLCLGCASWPRTECATPERCIRTIEELESSPTTPSDEPWRSMTIQDRDEFLIWTYKTIKDRWEMGRQKYHSDVLGFQGNPFEHRPEEIFDELVYGFYGQRKDTAQQQQIQELMELLRQSRLYVNLIAPALAREIDAALGTEVEPCPKQ